MGIRLLVLVLVLGIGAVPALAAQKAQNGAVSETKQLTMTYAKGVEQMNARQWNAAIDSFALVIDNAKTPKDIQANALADRGSCYANKKMYDEAMADLNKALEIKPDLQNALYERARLYAMLGKHSEAVADLTKVIDMQKASPATVITAGYYYNRGVSYMGMSPPQPERAKEDFAAAKKANPKLKIPVKYKDL